MSNFLNTLLDFGKKTITNVVNPDTASPSYNPGATAPWQGTPPIISTGDPLADTLRKVKEDLIDGFRGIARDTARAVAGGAADALEETEVFQRQKRLATFAALGIGGVAVAALVFSLRRA